MVILFTFLISFLAAQNQTQATEATVISRCEDALEGVTCIQKYQPRLRLSDEVKQPEPPKTAPETNSHK